MPAPPAGRASSTTSRSAESHGDLLEAFQSDTSRFALCPNDPGRLRGLIRDVGAAVERSAKPNTRRKDRSAWRKWVAFCRILNTPEMRTCVDAHSGLDAFGARRERSMQAAFFLYAFRTMIPRNRAQRTAKPASARACLDCVRRVHKHSNIAMCPAPSVALMLRGLMDEYVRIHGAECFVPHRREPLTNEQTRAILTIAPRTKLGARVVDWASSLFVNVAALLTALRQSGSRKADLLSVIPEEFDRASMTRWNLKWYINGEIVDCPALAQLRSLKAGDAAIIIPSCTKADPFSVVFGGKPIYLLFGAGEVCNAAWRLRELKLSSQSHQSTGGTSLSSARTMKARRSRTLLLTPFLVRRVFCASVLKLRGRSLFTVGAFGWHVRFSRQVTALPLFRPCVGGSRQRRCAYMRT